ncbi:sensor histidine kinase [Lentzea cavernae]|uniref:histidine kinase n=1 Tax=Lentzea cavernae TaxID=2020703 RepID=A0ABQ3MG24_9PSEU|nr:histidine kinase [Lentzea cavernae]GHH39451.1 two-component sensor histidine kinase [Lentzea cavernae]
MFSSVTALARTAARRVHRSEDDQPVARSLARQSIVVAAACLVTDVVSFATRGPDLGPANLVFLAGIVVADAALATSPRLSGWVALVHAVLVPVLAVALPGRSASTAGQLVAGYRAGAWLRGRPATGSLVVLAAGVLSSLLISGLSEPVTVLSLVVANALLPWLVGRYTTARKEYVDELRNQREAAVRDAEAELDQALTREREAIAIDLHDVIAHHVSAIGVHATAARLNLVDHGTGPVHTSLAAVEGSSRAAMIDLRRLLSLLHEGEASPDQPGLAKLPDLFDGVRASGLQVSFVVYHDPRPVQRGIDTMLYRVVQEMMTNALRHGDGGTARVELEYGDDHVSVTARNRIRSGEEHSRRDVPAGHQGMGLGLDGMRKRAEALGGSVQAGPAGDGQYWQTTVTMPAGSGS